MSRYVLNTSYIRERYGVVPAPPSPELGNRYARALKIIVGADGVVSDAEMQAFRDFAALLQVPEADVESFVAFDQTKARLEDFLEGLSDGPQTRQMLYDAIKIASADGYDPKEHEALLRAAKIHKVDPPTRS
jgi:tellurite resistance protein